MGRRRGLTLPAGGGPLDRRARRALRQDCARHIAKLDLRPPFDVRQVCASLASQRGRPIHLRPMELPDGGPCGLWLATPRADVICYDSAVSGLHRDHIILHEVGHLLFGHPGAPAVDAVTSQLLMPGLDPALVRRVLGRTQYSEAAEVAAETFATLVLARVAAERGRRRGGRSGLAEAGTDSEPLSRIERSLAPPD
jgi:hypothetical protein